MNIYATVIIICGILAALLGVMANMEWRSR